jgi:hypothetical protein
VVAGRIADMTDLMDEWRPFLVRWSQEWADAQDPDAPASERHVRDEEPVRTRWLGRSGSGTGCHPRTGRFWR